MSVRMILDRAAWYLEEVGRAVTSVLIVVVGGPPLVVINVLGALAWMYLDWLDDRDRARGNR